MKVDEAIYLLEGYGANINPNNPVAEDVKMGIEALEGLLSTQPEPCKDAVSRSDVFNVVEDVAYDVNAGVDSWYRLMNDKIRALQSVQQDRKKGEWIVDNDIPCICSECGTNWMDDYVDSRELYITGKIPNYCPNCGSDNRGEQDD